MEENREEMWDEAPQIIPGEPRRDGCAGRLPSGLPCGYSTPCDRCAPLDDAEMARIEGADELAAVPPEGWVS